MTGNPRAKNVGHAAQARVSSVSGARPIPPAISIEVQDTWLDVDDVIQLENFPAPTLAPPKPDAARIDEVERLVREYRLELDQVREEAQQRIEAALRERDAALAEVEVLRASLRPAFGGASTPPQLELPRIVQPPPLAPRPEPRSSESQGPATAATEPPTPPTPREPALREHTPREPGSVPTLSEVLVATDLPGHDPGTTDPDERRSEPRIQRQFELEFNYETHFFAGLTLDISSGGLFIATYHLFPVGTALSLSFQLPDGVRLSVRGEVRWVRCVSEEHERPGMGVAFKELSAEALAAISAFCAERPPLYMDL